MNQQTLNVEHADFELVISAEKLEEPLSLLTRTFRSRGLTLPEPDQVCIRVDRRVVSWSNENSLESPFFFENKPYWFDIAFKEHVVPNSATVLHKHRRIEESFTLSPRRNELRAMLNFGNDIGQCNFEIQYEANGHLKKVPVQFNVFATKMVQTQDLALMSQDIDAVYPLWRYAISSKTTQSQGESQRFHDKFELFWIAQLERLFSELNLGIKRIINAPHNRLQTFSSDFRLDRINKRLTAKQQERAYEMLASQRDTSRLKVDRKRLSMDTPENRFIKMVLIRTKKNLGQLIEAINSDRSKSVSDSYLRTVQHQRMQISKHLRHQLWREVGAYEGKNTESKVLQEAAGYSKVYRVWQQLKHYLNDASGEANLSVKSVAGIYEVWCFLEVMNILRSLGFEEEHRTLSKLRKSQFAREFTEDEMAAAFLFSRESDGMQIEVAHNPSFTPKGEQNRTWLANQRPDIVLRVTLSNNEQFLLLFDAKYRIDSGLSKAGDKVPEDAINQMHRYRDAIIHQEKISHEDPMKTRPVMGAFALYPGYFNQNAELNPYDEAIDAIGIGAFALLPSADGQSRHNQWLKSYLARKLGVHVAYDNQNRAPTNDYYFVEDSARIVPYGSNVVRHHGLTMVAPINELDRSPEYLECAKKGQLKGYHTQLMATNRQNVHRNIIREVRYLLLTVRSSETDRGQIGKFLYRVSSVKLLPRREIDDRFTGKPSAAHQHYWLFEFTGKPMQLEHGILLPEQEHFEFKLTKAEYLEHIRNWNDIKDQYHLYADFQSNW